MKTGIYQITNTVNGKCYIGSCAHYRGLLERLYRNKYRLNRNIHENPHLQNSWNKYGQLSFTFEILEYCSSEKCLRREQYYIDNFNPEYNICRIAGNNFGYRHTDEAKKKVSIANKGNTHHCDGNFVFQNIKSGILIVCAKYELCNQYNLDRSTLSKVCKGTEKSTGGWICLGKEKSYE